MELDQSNVARLEEGGFKWTDLTWNYYVLKHRIHNTNQQYPGGRSAAILQVQSAAEVTEGY